MLSRLAAIFDPLVRLLLVVIVLASFFPVTGEARVVARIVSDAAIFALFLLNGMRLPRQQIARALSHWQFLLPLIAWVFGAMGLLGALMGVAAENVLPSSVALGFLFLGVLPSTVQSATAYTSLAGGNTANSVIAAAVLNILGVFLTAPLLAWLASSDLPGVDFDGLERIGLIVVLPFILGQVLQRSLGSFVADNRKLVAWADRFAIGIAVYVAFSGAVEQDVWSLITPPAWVVLAGLIAVMLAAAFFGTWFLSSRLRLPEEDRIAFTFAGAQKSIAIGAPLATILFPPAMAGLVLLPVLFYHLAQLVISAPLAGWFSQRKTRAHPSREQERD